MLADTAATSRVSVPLAPMRFERFEGVAGGVIRNVGTMIARRFAPSTMAGGRGLRIQRLAAPTLSNPGSLGCVAF